MNEDQKYKFIMRAIQHMFRIIKVPFSEEIIKQPSWYQRITWSDYDRNRFKEWFLRILQKEYKLSASQAEKEWAFFDLSWGFKKKNNKPQS